MQLHGVGHTTTATTATLAAAPGAGVRIKVQGLHISTSGAATITIGFSATNQRVYTFAAAGIFDLGVMDWEGDANAALTAQSSASVTVDTTADYTLEVSPS
ncbi:MAG: hypothetical protein WB780_21200 [Candidatus Acidiferrales bacterium]